MEVLEFTDKGIFCPQGNFYIDPWQKVDYAVITHAHSDHARWGSRYYLAHERSAGILKLRLGQDISLQCLGYNQPLEINGVKVSLHPAGHIIGSAQVRVESRGEVWVVSGDYKTQSDGLSEPFEPVQCHVFITESTFGLPVYRWRPQQEVFDSINSWWAKNAAEGYNSIIYAYVLGKSQRLMSGVNPAIGPIVVHSGILATNAALGIKLPEAHSATSWPKGQTGALVIAPTSAQDSPWLRRFEPYRTAAASGWMAIRGNRRRGALDTGFVLSDHADWLGLLSSIEATGAHRVFVTHGYSQTLARYLTEKGIEARLVQTQFEVEASEAEFAAG